MSDIDIKTDKIDANGGQDQAPNWEAAPASSRYPHSTNELSLRRFRDEAEIHAISSALKQTGWNRKRAARLLSISYRSLLYKIRQHDITSNGERRTTVTADGWKIVMKTPGPGGGAI